MEISGSELHAFPDCSNGKGVVKLSVTSKSDGAEIEVCHGPDWNWGTGWHDIVCASANKALQRTLEDSRR